MDFAPPNWWGIFLPENSLIFVRCSKNYLDFAYAAYYIHYSAASSPPPFMLAQKLEFIMAKTSETNPINEGVEKFTAFVADATKSNQANLEALTTSAQILAKGTQEAATAGAAYAKSAFEAATEATKSLSGAKSLQEVVEIQADYSKAALATWMSEVTKITELLTTTYKDAAKPVSESLSAFTAKLQQAAQ